MSEQTVDEYRSRFKDAPWLPQGMNGDIDNEFVIVGGAGGIGSWLTLFLARAGFKPFVYDFDSYEKHNIGGQFCKKSDIGKFKVSALKDAVSQYANIDISTSVGQYGEGSMRSSYMFSGFDNMAAREVMFNNWVENWRENSHVEGFKPIFIDGRLLAEQMEIYCVTPDKIDRYMELLFSDDEIEDASCTMKQTSHAAAMIASKMVGYFTNHITNVNIGDDIRNVPFSHEYIIPIDFLKTEY